MNKFRMKNLRSEPPLLGTCFGDVREPSSCRRSLGSPVDGPLEPKWLRSRLGGLPPFRHPTTPGWVLEGSLAGLFGCHETDLEFVSGADFWCQWITGAGPVGLGGVGPGSIPGLKQWRTGPKSSSQIAFRYSVPRPHPRLIGLRCSRLSDASLRAPVPSDHLPRVVGLGG